MGRAKKALDRLRWSSDVTTAERSFKEVFPFISEPNPMQRAVIELAENMKGPGVVILEAPMGEGKTEAALYLAERWSRHLGQDGLFIALPTQATADQMFVRTVDYLKGTGRSVNLALVHGHAVLSDEYQQLKVSDDDPDMPGSAIVAEEWFTYKKRGVLSPFGVGTVDQALMSVIRQNISSCACSGCPERSS